MTKVDLPFVPGDVVVSIRNGESQARAAIVTSVVVRGPDTFDYWTKHHPKADPYRDGVVHTPQTWLASRLAWLQEQTAIAVKTAAQLEKDIEAMKAEVSK